ncbi:MAG: hypothetical protein WC979_00220 [Candidatus Pacearchaeota archaeon]|jgi:hypothetical protein|nr:hypothetical protein [Clostridia bacterium]
METKEIIEGKELLKNSKPLNINCLAEEMSNLVLLKLAFALTVNQNSISPEVRCKEVDDLLISEIRVNRLINIYKPGVN